MAITSNQEDSPVANRSVEVAGWTALPPRPPQASPWLLPAVCLLLNATDRIQYEWYKGMANGTTLKTVAAVLALSIRLTWLFQSQPVLSLSVRQQFCKQAELFHRPLIINRNSNV